MPLQAMLANIRQPHKWVRTLLTANLRHRQDPQYTFFWFSTWVPRADALCFDAQCGFVLPSKPTS